MMACPGKLKSKRLEERLVPVQVLFTQGVQEFQDEIILAHRAAHRDE